MPDEEAAAHASWQIARDFGRTLEYIGAEDRSAWPFVPQTFGMKIGIERGSLEVTTIHSDFLGEQPFIVGEASIYATRLLGFGQGNRCLIGPKAAARWVYEDLEGPFIEKGKHEGVEYEYYTCDLIDMWEP